MKSIKKQFSLGIMSAMIALMMIAGGTFAYFSDSVTQTSTFAAGTLDLSVEPTELINIDNIKPGDTMIRDFVLANNGTLDMEKVTIDTDYTVTDAQGDNTEDFGSHIRVEFLMNMNNLDEVIYETTLEELKTMSPEAINEHIFYPTLGEQGLAAGEAHDLVVKFAFVDNGEDQNQFQGDSLELEWTFIATQTAGEQK